MAKPIPWISSLTTTVAASADWNMPQGWWQKGDGYMGAYVLLWIDALTTSGGTLTAKLQTTPAATDTADGWMDTDTEAAISAAGAYVLAADGVMGPTRLTIRANAASVTFTMRAELLFKQPVASESMDWLPQRYFNFAGSGTQYIAADQWLDVTQWLNVYALAEWQTMTGSAANVTVKLQSAAALSDDDNAWIDVDTSVMTGLIAILEGRSTATNPPMAVLRLAVTAAAAVSGTLRVALLLKEQ